MLKATSTVDIAMANSMIDTVVELARDASMEINVQDVDDLPACRDYLSAGTKVYVSHLPRQAWSATIDTCTQVRESGYEPIPHVPVRLLKSSSELRGLFSALQCKARVEEVLLIAGDYPKSAGPYASVDQVLRSFPISEFGINKVSFAGHPEGHPNVNRTTIRRAEVEKAKIATDLQLETTLLTQFFFESEPFLQWANELRNEGVTARLVGGIAGPASLTTLFKFALRCGVGPSMRALGNRSGTLLKLVGEYGPEELIAELASARSAHPFSGIHLFCFGGFLRTCKWLHAVAHGHFVIDDMDGFRVRR